MANRDNAPRSLRHVVVGALLAAAACAAWFDPLDVTILNRTPMVLAGLGMVTGSGSRTTIPAVMAGAAVSVRPQLGAGEDSLYLVDPHGRRYPLLDYFEGDPGGEVTIVIEAFSSDGLQGRALDRSRYAPAGDRPLVPAR